MFWLGEIAKEVLFKNFCFFDQLGVSMLLSLGIWSFEDKNLFQRTAFHRDQGITVASSWPLALGSLGSLAHFAQARRQDLA